MPNWSDGSSGPVSESFLRRANEAAFWEAWVGAVLSRAGLYTVHHPFTADGSDSHSQTFDISVHDTEPGRDGWGSPVEVKSVNLTFTGPTDYPLETVLVCSQNSWLRKWPGRDETKRDFLFVSRHTGAIVWLPIYSKVTLGNEIHDRSRNETYSAVTTLRKFLQPLQSFVEVLH